jgi:hypothetical protein
VRDEGEDKLEFRELPGFGDLMTWEDFVDNVECGGFIDYDGYGELAMATQVSNVTICPSDVEGFVRPDWATHVLWYNK